MSDDLKTLMEILTELLAEIKAMHETMKAKK